MDKKDKDACEVSGLRDFPGAAIDVADDEKVSETAVDDRTKAQNDNPRNNDLDE